MASESPSDVEEEEKVADVRISQRQDISWVASESASDVEGDGGGGKKVREEPKLLSDDVQ